MRFAVPLTVVVAITTAIACAKAKNANMPNIKKQMKKMDKIPVYILTGFLGSGKTTALNHLLNLFSNSNNVVIENEFGAIAIDTRLVNTMYSDIYELSNGCICCNLDDDLYNILCHIERSKTRPDNLFIETTGIADAGNVAAIFTREDVRQVFDLRKIICLADSENLEELLHEAPEALRQLVAADLIVLNKIDCLSPAYVSRVQALVKSVNPFAAVITTTMAAIPYEDLCSENIITPPWQSHKQEIKKRGSEHKIVSVSFATNDAFDINSLRYALSVTLMLHYKQVYRIKGIVKAFGSNNKVLLQSTGRSVQTQIMGPWQNPEETVSQIVIIGIGLKKDTVEKICRTAICSSVNNKLV